MEKGFFLALVLAYSSSGEYVDQLVHHFVPDLIHQLQNGQQFKFVRMFMVSRGLIILTWVIQTFPAYHNYGDIICCIVKYLNIYWMDSYGIWYIQYIHGPHRIDCNFVVVC